LPGKSNFFKFPEKIEIFLKFAWKNQIFLKLPEKIDTVRKFAWKNRISFCKIA